MPYYVFKVFPNRTVDFIEQFDKYHDAKKYTRELRTQIEEDEIHTFRLVHAKHEREAERLLTIKREPRPLGEE